MNAKRNPKGILTQSEKKKIMLCLLMMLVAVAYAFYLSTHRHHSRDSGRRDNGATVQPEGN